MKLSSVFHLVGRVVGAVGGIALVASWFTGESGTVFGFAQQQLFWNSIALILVSISAMVCGLFYLRLEETNKSYV